MTHNVGAQTERAAVEATKKTMTAVARERVRQLKLWGVQRRTFVRPGDRLWYEHQANELKARFVEGVTPWDDILLEEVYEALAEESRSAMRIELHQVMAVCQSMIEQIEEELCISTAPVQASTPTGAAKHG